MPSPEHDGLGQFFKDDPQLAVKIARDILKIDVPATPRGFTPFEADVVGPRDIPRITHHAHARDFPGLAAISVAVHGDREVVNAFVDALRDLPEECRPRYYEYIHKLARAEAQALLEERMHSAPWIVSSPFAREHFGRGRAEGKAEGKAEGEAKAILLVLKSRDISISAEDAERISACTDLPQLEVWATRAAKATSIEDVLH